MRYFKAGNLSGTRRAVHRGALAMMLAGTFLTGTAQAQVADQADASGDRTGGVGEIVVTAQKRGENLQNVPIAINAMTSEALQSQGITTIQGVVAATPTLYQAPYPTSNTTLFLFMRAMGVGDPVQVTKDGSIGIYQNGIYNARPQALAFDLADIERVEILRGPQGTLYGRNTTGGAVNIISRAPSGELGLRGTASYGSRNQYRAVAHLDLPEFANISAKLSLAAGGDDGWGKNRTEAGVTRTNNFHSENHIAARAAVRWQPSDSFTADYTFEIGKVKSTPMLLESPGLDGQTIYPGIVYEARRDHAYRPVSLPKSESRIRDHGLTLNWQVSPSFALRSITGIRYFKTYTYQDTLEVYLVPLVSTNDIVSKQFSQEFQIVGDAWDDRVKYTAGLYFFREKAVHGQMFDIAQGATVTDLAINAKATSKAAYAQVTITPPVLNDRLDLTLGGRYTQDKRRADRSQWFNGGQFENAIANRQTFRRFTPSVTLNYRWNDDVSTYAKMARGYRAGGSSETTPDFTTTFGPESLTSYEVGLKSELFDRHLRFNVAAFYNKYKDIQLDITVDPFNPTISETRNAGRATIKGLEADITAALSRDLSLSLSYAYLHSKIKSVNVDGGPNIADLFTIPYAPKHSVNVAADWTLARFDKSDVSLHLNYSYKSKVYNTAGAGPAVNNRDYYSTKGYSLVNGRLTWSTEWDERPVSVSLWAKNILNDRYPVYSTGPGAQLTGYFYQAFTYNAPRSVGVEVSFEL